MLLTPASASATTSRSNTYIRCGPYMYSYVLARCDGDGKNIYIISRNNECDWLPTLLASPRSHRLVVPGAVTLLGGR